VAERIRIVVADDHPFFRNGLRTALKSSHGFKLVGEAGDGVSALEQIQKLKPDVAILDIGLPLMNGVAVTRCVRQEQIPVDVIFLTVAQDEEIFETALELGVKGYLLKDCTDTELYACIRTVRSGAHYLTPSMTTHLVNKTSRIDEFANIVPGLKLLTSHERAILRRIAQDKTSKEIAVELGIAVKTVDTHRTNICRKLEIHGQHVLTRFAARHRTEI